MSKHTKEDFNISKNSNGHFAYLPSSRGTGSEYLRQSLVVNANTGGNTNYMDCYFPSKAAVEAALDKYLAAQQRLEMTGERYKYEDFTFEGNFAYTEDEQGQSEKFLRTCGTLKEGPSENGIGFDDCYFKSKEDVKQAVRDFVNKQEPNSLVGKWYKSNWECGEIFRITGESQRSCFGTGNKGTQLDHAKDFLLSAWTEIPAPEQDISEYSDYKDGEWVLKEPEYVDANGDPIIIGDVYHQKGSYRILVEEFTREYSDTHCKGPVAYPSEAFTDDDGLNRNLLVPEKDQDFWKRCFKDKKKYLKEEDLVVDEIYQKVFPDTENSVFQYSDTGRVLWQGFASSPAKMQDTGDVICDTTRFPILPATKEQKEIFTTACMNSRSTKEVYMSSQKAFSEAGNSFVNVGKDLTGTKTGTTITTCDLPTEPWTVTTTLCKYRADVHVVDEADSQWPERPTLERYDAADPEQNPYGDVFICPAGYTLQQYRHVKAGDLVVCPESSEIVLAGKVAEAGSLAGGWKRWVVTKDKQSIAKRVWVCLFGEKV